MPRKPAKAASTRKSFTSYPRSGPARRSPRCAGGSASASRRSTAGKSSSAGWARRSRASSGSLRHKNAKVRQVVADLTLDRHILHKVGGSRRRKRSA
jgi:hypothetical protein